MKKLFKEAHQMAREIKNQYPEVDYKTQFGLCLSYLSNKEEEEMLPELEGTEKQVAWANKIRTQLINIYTDTLNGMYFYTSGLYKMTQEELIELAKSNGATDEQVPAALKGLEAPRAEYEAQIAKIEKVKTTTSAKWLIENR